MQKNKYFFRQCSLLILLTKFLISLQKYGLTATLTKIKNYLELSFFQRPNHDTLSILYQNWILKFKNNFECAADIDGVFFSILMPVYMPNIGWLIEAIESVLAQHHTNWELCIADDFSNDIKVTKTLKSYQERDARIKVVFRTSNGHISAASNTALDIASGEWLVLLDQDDLLEKSALSHLARVISCNEEVEMIYSDEDKINYNGTRFDPYFKSDWNPDLFYSHNMFSHLGCYKRSLVMKVHGFRVGYEGAQDYDLALRCTEKIESKQIYHIPRVLYHWRSHPASTASGADLAKPYAMLAGEKAINDHLARLKVNASVKLTASGYRISYDISDPKPKASIVIPTRNNFALLKKCIDSIFNKTTYSNYEILVINNNTDDPKTLKFLNQLSGDPRITIIHNSDPFNYSTLNNKAVKFASGEVLVLMNNDIEVITPEWLSELISHAIRPEIGAVGAKLWYPDNTIQHAGLILGVGGVANSAHHRLGKHQDDYFSKSNLVQSVSAVTAACLAVKKSLYEKVGGLDEENLGIAFNDVDFCLKLLELGYRNIYTPYAELFHHESASRGYDTSPEKQARLAKEEAFMWDRWGDILRNDPAYNPNLSNIKTDFTLAFPPRI
jgi:GT2 family glycosyltransferase